jgi:hypothetical protein
VKFNYKSNIDHNLGEEDKKIITLGKNNNINTGTLES